MSFMKHCFKSWSLEKSGKSLLTLSAVFDKGLTSNYSNVAFIHKHVHYVIAVFDKELTSNYSNMTFIHYTYIVVQVLTVRYHERRRIKNIRRNHFKM